MVALLPAAAMQQFLHSNLALQPAVARTCRFAAAAPPGDLEGQLAELRAKYQADEIVMIVMRDQMRDLRKQIKDLKANNTGQVRSLVCNSLLLCNALRSRAMPAPAGYSCMEQGHPAIPLPIRGASDLQPASPCVCDT